VVGVAGVGHEGPRPALAFEGSAEMRASLVRELLPLLGLEGRVTIDGPHASVPFGAQTFRLHLGSGEVRLDPDDRPLDLEGLERSDSPLYMPHEGSDSATAAILATLVWLVQYAQHAQRR
jgi:hypothetical protein